MSHKSNSDLVPRILEAAVIVFSQSGLEAARMEDIADAAGVSKGTLYLYFKNKDALIIALGEQIFMQELVSYRELVTAPGTLRDRLQALTRAVLADSERIQKLQPLIYEFFALGGRNPQARQILQTYFDQSLQTFCWLVEDAIARGEIRPTDVQQVALMLGAQIDGILLWQRYHPASVDLEKQISFGFNLVLDVLNVKP